MIRIPVKEFIGNHSGVLPSLIANINVIIDGFTTVKIPTGIGVEIPEGYCIQIRNILNNAYKGIIVPTGLIDYDYRGELFVILSNMTPKSININQGDIIAQIVVLPFIKPIFEVVDEFFTNTSRGDGGFGSTNVGSKESTPSVTSWSTNVGSKESTPSVTSWSTNVGSKESTPSVTSWSTNVGSKESTNFNEVSANNKKKCIIVGVEPLYMTDGAAGGDITICGDVIIPAHGIREIQTNSKIMGGIYPTFVNTRSSIGAKGIYIMNEFYRSNDLILFNTTNKDIYLEDNQRIAQLVFCI